MSNLYTPMLIVKYYYNFELLITWSKVKGHTKFDLLNNFTYNFWYVHGRNTKVVSCERVSWEQQNAVVSMAITVFLQRSNEVKGQKSAFLAFLCSCNAILCWNLIQWIQILLRYKDFDKCKYTDDCSYILSQFWVVDHMIKGQRSH